MTEEEIQDDLAFMRSIVAGSGGESMQAFGRIYFAAGICYGAQCLLSGTRMLGWPPGGGTVDLIIHIAPTIVFLALLAWLNIRDREANLRAGGSSRAIGAIFASAGMTNIVMIVTIGFIAWKQQNLQIWMIYPCLVMILQGMSWLFVYMMRRRAWLGLVSAGWFATSIGMAVALASENLTAFVIIVSIGLFAFMAVPGAYLMRPDHRDT